jgi:hypothetical protein
MGGGYGIVAAEPLLNGHRRHRLNHGPFDTAEGDALLLQPQRLVTQPAPAQVVIDASLGLVQARQLALRRLRLKRPLRLVLEQGVVVHQERLCVREPGTQLVEDGKAVGVDVTPVVQAALLQPGCPCHGFEAIAGAEDHQASRGRR